MAARPHPTIQDDTAERCAAVVTALRTGDTLTWALDTGYVLTQRTGERTRIRWYVGAALRRQGTIITDTPGLYDAKVWRLAAPPATAPADAEDAASAELFGDDDPAAA